MHTARLLFPLIMLPLTFAIPSGASADEGLGHLKTELAKTELAKEVRSILSNRCFACHGPDEDERQGGFRLDERASFTGEADSGLKPVEPGHAADSELLRRLLGPAGGVR